MSKNKKSKSACSAKSDHSLESVGIGFTPTESTARTKFIANDFAIAENRLCDSVVLLIYCPEHHKVAIINTRQEHIVWMPFLQLHDGLSWTQGTLDCIQRAIGRQDAEQNEAEAAEQAPKFDLAYFDVTRIQAPSVNAITRICQLVTLKSGTSFKCCIKSRKIEWIPLAMLSKEHDDSHRHYWGPELRMWCDKLAKMLIATPKEREMHPHPVMHERNIAQELQYFAAEQKEQAEHKAILGIKLKPAHAVEVYEDYLKHCYPSLFMHIDSFRLYLAKYLQKHHGDNHSSSGSKKSFHHVDENHHRRAAELYDLFRSKNKTYLNFKELLIGLIVMDPNCKDKCEARIRFLFRYYAKRKAAFTEEDLRKMVTILHSDASQTDLEKHYRKALSNFEVASPDQVTFTTFYKTIMGEKYDVSKLMRFEHSVLAMASPQFGHKVASLKKKQQATSLTGTNKQEGECFGCRQKDCEYGMHVVTIDTGRRAINPIIIDMAWLDESRYADHRRYSIDYTFSNTATCNIFLDLIRVFNSQKGHPQSSVGLMSDEGNVFVRHLQRLVRQLNGILSAEPKLIKLNGPAIVVGDIQGNLTDLLAIEEALFSSFPVVSENLIFLGNYTGEHPFGVECLLYLFAMKIAAPNKVFLLRGNAETRVLSSQTLRNECFTKYGRTRAELVYEALNDIFTKLPIAAVLDEHILCVHSGIPSTNGKIEDLAKLPVQLFDVQRDGPIAYEIMTRYPLTYNPTQHHGHTVEHELLGQRQGDLAFHSAPRSTSLTSIDSRSYVEATIKSSEIKSNRETGHHRTHSKDGHKRSPSVHRTKSNDKAHHHHRRKSSSSIKSNDKHRHSENKHSKSLEVKSKDGRVQTTKSNHSTKSTKSTERHHKSADKSHERKSSLKAKSSEIHRSTSKKHKSSSGKLAQTKSDGGATLKSIKSGERTSSKTAIKSHSNIIEKTRSSPLPKTSSNGTHRSKSSASSGHFRNSSSPIQLAKPDAGYHPEPKDEETFDGRAFHEFMSFNNLEFLIRGSSVCKHGFKVNFKSRCLSVFSCSNMGIYKNKAAVLLVDRQTASIRFMALKTPEKNVKGTSNTTLKN